MNITTRVWYNTLRRFNLASLYFRRNLVHTPGEHVLDYQRKVIGNREIVGFGVNGKPMYHDLTAFPMPAIRYKEPTAEILALHEKEKGDWRLLTIEEKKKLYRASFCQTFVEFKATSTEWMSIVGYTLIYCSLGIWLYMIFATYAYPPLPITFTRSSRKEQLKRMINMRAGPITGPAADWDYEKKDWKHKGWNTPPNPFLKDENECEDED